MNNKQLKTLGIILGVVLILALVLTLLNSFNSRSSNQSLVDNTVKIIEFELSYSINNLNFKINDSGNWNVSSNNDEFIANNEKVNKLLDTLRESKILNVASTNQNNYGLFNVDDKSASVLSILDNGKKVKTIIIGKSATEGNYVRIEGDTNVYLINQSLNNLTIQDLEEFRDKTLSKGSIEDLNYVESSSFKIIKEDEYKLDNNSSKLDQSATRSFLENLINLKAFEIATQADVAKLNRLKPDITYEISFKNSNKFSFEIYNIDDNTILAKRIADGSILKLDKSQFDNINKSLQDLKAS